MLEGFIERLELLREEFVGENTLKAARRLGLLVCRSEGPWRVPAEEGAPGHGQVQQAGLDAKVMVPTLTTLPQQTQLLPGQVTKPCAGAG